MRSQVESVARIGDALVAFSAAFQQSQAYAAKKLGINVTDLSCIGLLLTTTTPQSPHTISRYLQISDSSGTALLDRLEKAGFIIRIPHPDDRRRVQVVLDRSRAASAVAFYRDVRKQVISVIEDRSEAERNVIFAFLTELSAGLDARIKASTAQISPKTVSAANEE